MIAMDVATIWSGLVSLVTLTLLEVVLGVDNLVFISIVSSRLPVEQQKIARRLGLLLALVTRLLLLAGVVWIIGLQRPFLFIGEWALSARDLFMLAGGAFLVFKGTVEIHTEFEPTHTDKRLRKLAGLPATIIQIGLFDIIFSLDSVLTAIGLTQHYFIMAIAITIAIIVMLVASEPLSRFVNTHPTVKMLALSFLLLIGVVLIADGLHFHIPRGYIYFAVCYSLLVEALNNLIRRRRKKT